MKTQINSNPAQETLVIGQKVYCSLHHAGTGYINRISGKQSPESCRSMLGGIGVMGGNATIHIVFDNYFSEVPESLVRSSVQWEVYPDVISREELDKAIAETQTRLDAKALAKAKANLEKQTEETRQRTAPEYAHLTPCDEYNRLVTAKNIRAELKKYFPGIKFSVRKGSGRGSLSINVEWVDGPCREAVETKLENFKRIASYDVDDSAQYKRHAWIFGTTEYLFCNHDYSDEVLQAAIDKINARYKVNGTVALYRQGNLPPLYEGCNWNRFSEELRKVLSGEINYDLENKRDNRFFDVGNILNDQYGFTGGYKKDGSKLFLYFNSNEWQITTHYQEYVVIADDHTRPALDIATEINAAYDLANDEVTEEIATHNLLQLVA